MIIFVAIDQQYMVEIKLQLPVFQHLTDRMRRAFHAQRTDIPIAIKFVGNVNIESGIGSGILKLDIRVSRTKIPNCLPRSFPCGEE